MAAHTAPLSPPDPPPQTQPPNIPSRENAPTGMKLGVVCSEGAFRKAHLVLDTFSPVNQNGSFEFDRVIKSAQVLKRTKKTKSWKPVFLVLRPTTLSIYKDAEGTQLRHQIALADLEAVARQKDPKRKAKHVFGLFSPAQNYHIEAASEKEAQEWVELIRRESRIDEEEEEMLLLSPTASQRPNPAASLGSGRPPRASDPAITSSSDPDAPAPLARPKGRSPYGPHSLTPATMHSAARRPSHPLHASSGNDGGSCSSISSGGAFRGSAASLPKTPSLPPTDALASTAAAAGPAPRPLATRSASQHSATDAERIVHQGWLGRQRGGALRAWKAQWAVLRPSRLALYDDAAEYKPSLIIPFAGIIDAVEVERPADRRRGRCVFMVIGEEGGWRFDGGSEESVLRWLGAIKSLVARRKERVLLGEREDGEVKDEEGHREGAGKEIVNAVEGKYEKPESAATALPVR